MSQWAVFFEVSVTALIILLSVRALFSSAEVKFFAHIKSVMILASMIGVMGVLGLEINHAAAIDDTAADHALVADILAGAAR